MTKIDYQKRKEEMKNLRLQGMNGADIGEIYGISRERVRQIIGNIRPEKDKIFNNILSRINPNMTRDDVLQIIPTGYQNKALSYFGTIRHAIKGGASKLGALGEETAREILAARGYNCELMPFSCPYDLLVNGYRVDVKSPTTPYWGKSTVNPSYRISRIKNGSQCDYFIWLIPLDDDKTIFVVPSGELRGYQSLRLCWPSNHHSKWAQWIDRFDLLEIPLFKTSESPS